MRRKDREVTDFSAIIGIIGACPIVRIGLADGDFPYIVPVNFAYEVEGEQIYLYIHSAKAGRKFGLMQKNGKCSFEMDVFGGVIAMPEKKDSTTIYHSVMGEAEIEFLEGDDAYRGAQKLMVFFVSGGALYGENAVFSSLPSFNSLVVGGNGAIFDFSGVLFQRPQQLFNSECSWNANYRPEGETLALDDREKQGIEYRKRMGKRDFIDPRHLDPDGFLAKCCKLLYGDKAGKLIFRYQTLRTAHGDGPLALLYQQIVMEKLFRKLNSKPTPDAKPESLGRPVLSYEDAALRWEEQAEITRLGAKLISNAMPSVKGWLGKELQRQAAQLRIGAVFAELIGKIYRCLDGAATPKSNLLEMVRKLRLMMHRLPHEYPSLEDGDGALYERHLENLTEFIEGMGQPQ